MLMITDCGALTTTMIIKTNGTITITITITFITTTNITTVCKYYHYLTS